MKNLTLIGNRYFFNGEKSYYMVQGFYGEFRVYNNGEYIGKYCGTIRHLETFVNGSAALDYVFAGL